MPNSEASPPNPSINLGAIVENHLKRLFDLRDAVGACHSGLVASSEMNWEIYRAGLPPQPGAAVHPSYSKVHEQAVSWLAANALKDLLTLHVIFFEHIRQFLELADVNDLALGAEEKNTEATKRIQSKPENLESAGNELARLLVGGFSRQPEMRSLETLFAIFAAQAAGTQPSGNAEWAVATLCQPELGEEPQGEGGVPYTVRRIRRNLGSESEVRLDKELLYQIFFTAFAITRDIAEACQNTFIAKHEGKAGHSPA